MPLPKLTDLTPEQQERYQEAHEAFLRADSLEIAIDELREPEHPDYIREGWEKHVIPILQAERDKADAEHWRIMRELGYEGR